MRPHRRRLLPTCASTSFLNAVPEEMQALFDRQGMLLSPRTRPWMAAGVVSVRLVWRNRRAGLSHVVTVRLSSTPAWHLGAAIAEALHV